MGLKTPLLKIANFADKVFNNDKDVLVLLYTSQFPETSKKNHNDPFAVIMVNLKKKFEAVGVKSVKFLAADMNVEQGLTVIGKWNEIDEAPMLLLFRANHKELKDVIKFYGKLLQRDVAKFVHKRADIKFSFTDRLHMDYIEDDGSPDSDYDDNMRHMLLI